MKSPRPSPTRPLLLQASTRYPLAALLPLLVKRLASLENFVQHHQVSSGRCAWILLEMHRRSSVETYSAILASGLELSRAAHTALASLCPPDSRTLRCGSAPLVTVRLEIRALDDLHPSLFTPTLAISA